MVNNESSQRPVRKLTVKNFSVIKDAELEFGKITVLIGPEASGKSLLCRLAYFFSREIVFIAEERIKLRRDYASFQDSLVREFERWFPRTAWGTQNWHVGFTAGDYSVHLSKKDAERSEPKLSISDTFRLGYESGRLLAFPDISYLPAKQIRGLSGTGVWDRATYIPSERTYFVDTNKGYAVLSGDPDPIIKKFAPLFQNSLASDIPRERLYSFLQGTLVAGEDSWRFAFEDGRTLALNALSSGSKELLPLLSVLDMYEHQRPSTLTQINAGIAQEDWYYFDDFYIEEPEAHVFPTTQKRLVQYFSELVNSSKFRARTIITTHSPYVLSAFGNLIKAGDIAKSMPSHVPSVESIVPRQYWIDREEFRAYALKPSQKEPGKFILDPIFDRNAGELNGDYLDDVSSEIAEEFSQLLEIQYGG